MMAGMSGSNLLPARDHWTFTDSVLGGAVSYVTNFYVTSALPPERLAQVMSRVACFYMIGQMNDLSIKEATTALADIYGWQISSALIPEPTTQVVATTTIDPKTTFTTLGG